MEKANKVHPVDKITIDFLKGFITEEQAFKEHNQMFADVAAEIVGTSGPVSEQKETLQLLNACKTIAGHVYGTPGPKLTEELQCLRVMTTLDFIESRYSEGVLSEVDALCCLQGMCGCMTTKHNTDAINSLHMKLRKGNRENMKHCIIFDLDGTLADTSHRVKYIDGSMGRKDFDKFHELCDEDTVKEHIKEICNMYYKDYCVIVLTGRLESAREVTKCWLQQNGIKHDMLFMRPTSERMSKDSVWKAGMVEHIKATMGLTPKVVFEDRQRVIDMWRSLGIPVISVDPGDF